MTLHHDSNRGHAIELSGDGLSIYAWDRGDNVLFQWDGLAWECPPFMALMPEHWHPDSAFFDEAKYIAGHEEELIAWAAEQEGYELNAKAA